jgi:putative nucleotidyltransferase with HDIG domain
MDRVRFVGELREARDELAHACAELDHLYHGVIEALSAATSQCDPYTAFHQGRVAHLASAIAQRLDVGPEVLEGVTTAALLHDIGKITVPAEILNKPFELSEMEFGLIQAHAEIGHSLLQAVAFRQPVATIVLQHHERLDGSGYPQGLSEDDILLESQILAVADVVEAMASDRPYRPALGLDAALEEIGRFAGVKYDADVVDACTSVIESGEIDYWREAVRSESSGLGE